MAQKKGQYAELWVKVATTPTAAAKLTNWSISTSAEKITATAAGDTWDSHLIGIHSWEGSADISEVDSFWWDLVTGDALVEIVFYDGVKATIGTVVYTGNASIDFDQDTPFDDLITASISFTGSGELVKTIVSV